MFYSSLAKSNKTCVILDFSQNCRWFFLLMPPWYIRLFLSWIESSKPHRKKVWDFLIIFLYLTRQYLNVVFCLAHSHKKSYRNPDLPCYKIVGYWMSLSIVCTINLFIWGWHWSVGRELRNGKPAGWIEGGWVIKWQCCCSNRKVPDSPLEP